MAPVPRSTLRWQPFVVRTDRYGDDQTEVAEAHFQSLSEEARANGTLWNMAVRSGGCANTWTRRGEDAHLRGGLASAELVDSPVLGVESRTVLAIRGERLALTEVRDDRRSPPFHQLDLYVEKRWVFEQWYLEAYLDVQNVYNHTNTEFFAPTFDFKDTVPIPSLPILPTLGVRGVF